MPGIRREGESREGECRRKGEMAELHKWWHNRWLVLVAAIWMQSCAGIGYVFGSLSPAIKSSLHYNQKQINRLGVAKDIGDSVGLLAGTLCEILPTWGILLAGALQNLVGYGWLWLVVLHKVPALPFWGMCVLICIGTNGETYFNTASLVSCVRNFPKSRGPIVGILKGFAGLSGAIFTQIYTAMYAPDQAAFIFMVAIGPFMVAMGVMFILRPVAGPKETDPSDSTRFKFIYGLCMLLAAYLMGVMLVQDVLDVKRTASIICTIALLVILIIPLALPLLSISADSSSCPPANTDKEPLLENNQRKGSYYGQGIVKNSVDINEVLLSELEDEKPKEVDFLPEWERRKRLAQLHSRLLHAAAEGAVRIKRKKGPRRGEDFTLMQALIKADFWLMFFGLLFGAGSGLTVIDNLGQLSQSLGYDNSHMFVSLISIWNFLGRIGGGFLSEIVARSYAYPRPVTMAAAQVIMAVGHFVLAMAWPGSLYAGTLLVGLGYGAHWSIIPATASELFGLKYFGILYNFLTIANPAGSLIFSGLIAGTIYDWEAEKQNPPINPSHSLAPHMLGGLLKGDEPLKCEGRVCFFLTCLIMTGVCVIGVILSMILVYRTQNVYRNIYGRHLQSEKSSFGEEVTKAKVVQDQEASCSN